MDKNAELKANLTLINDRLHFSGSVDGQAAVSIDYIPPFGDDLGYTSLELFLLSLGSCLGTALLVLLRRMNRKVEGLEIDLNGTRRSTHPTAFDRIHIHLLLISPNASREDIGPILSLAEGSLCPVWAMIKGNVDVTTTVEIRRLGQEV